MAGRLQLIEQKLTSIDPANFQNLCDTYLILRENEYSSFNRTGSQLGKQKTILGTPDSFMRLTNNKLAYIEYTTQTDSKVSKIKDDITKCLETSNTGIKRENLYQIIICYNSRLTEKEEFKIQKFAKENKINIELIGIDTLAIEIYSKYLLLSRDFLDIPIDTGQILPFKKFIDEYNNKANQLSTPLDNEFLHREVELNEILDHLASSDLIILSGAPGVGKTKIGIESISKFIKLNPNFQSFAISQKDVDIFEDLKIQLSSEKDYILLIDDANRQLTNLSQIFGVFRENRIGKIKIVITVRNYALSDIYNTCIDFLSHTVSINKFKDDEIKSIIESDSFKILNPKYQKKIIEIADGNVRLAIMAAKLANEKQADFLWGDVADLFDNYFNKFLSDFNIFQNESLLKTLAIISFFFTIDRNNKIFIKSIIDLFDIDYYIFNESIEELHKRELIEIKYNHARVSEQVMATYFFYKVFIKDELLSFKTLLFNFFPFYKNRFNEAVISSNNSFGYDNVFSKINQSLSDFLIKNSNDEELILEFLDLFWFYKPEETLSHFYNKITLLPEPKSPIYLTNYETNDFVNDREQTLDFISRLFDHLTDNFIPAIELAFEYVRKKPELLPEFIRRIREHLQFDEPDERIGFQRQVKFIDKLISKTNDKETHYTSAFFALSKTFLNHYSDIAHGGRKHSITWYKYPLPLYEVTKDIRTKIWHALFEKYDSYPDEVLDVLKEIKINFHDIINGIMDFDLSIVVPFIKDNFLPTSFEQTHFINEMIYWLDRIEGLKDRAYRDLKQTFHTNDYIDYCNLSWNRFRAKQDYDFDDHNEYERLKANEIKNHFTFTNTNEFLKLEHTISNILKIKDENHYSVSNSLDIVIKSNFEKNKKVGFSLLSKILINYPASFSFLYGTVSVITKASEDWCRKLWDLIENWESQNSIFWKINFFNCIQDEFINEFYCQKLVETIKSINDNGYIYLENYTRFSSIKKDIVEEILKITIDKNASKKMKIVFTDDVFENDIHLLTSDYKLLKIAYFQQYNFNHSHIFDYHGKGFKQLFFFNNCFLLDFLKEFCTKKYFCSRDFRIRLNFIWDDNVPSEIIIEASEFLIENNFLIGGGNHMHSILFKDLSANGKEKAYNFILKRIELFKNETNRIRIYFDTIRSFLNEKFENALIFYLTHNSNVDDFKKINWAGHVGAQVGEVIFGELYAKRWEGILDIVSRSEKTIQLIPIKNFLKGKILEQYKWAESERRSNFLTPNY